MIFRWQVGTACADIRGPEHGKRCEDVCFQLRKWLDLRLRVTNDYRAEFSKPEDCKKRLKGSWISTVKVKLIDLVESCQLQHIWLRQQATSKVYWPAYESPSSTPTPKSFLVAWGTSKLCSYTWTPRLRLVSCILLKWMAWHYDSQRWRFSLNTLDLWCR